MRNTLASSPSMTEEVSGRDNAPADLLAKAAQCRRLAAGICDAQASEVLLAMADNYEAGARLKT